MRDFGEYVALPEIYHWHHGDAALSRGYGSRGRMPRSAEVMGHVAGGCAGLRLPVTWQDAMEGQGYGSRSGLCNDLPELL